jgi:predicted  nucleic acid-binding Zn-ribbon protein
MAKTKKPLTAEDRLRALYDLQLIDSRIDRIRVVRGELPLEVEDLENEIGGLKTRLEKMEEENDNVSQRVTAYEDQKNNVRNNREFESLNKEVEYQTLEIELCEKRIRECKAQQVQKAEGLENLRSKNSQRTADLSAKQSELDEIIAETQAEEEVLLKQSDKMAKTIDERLLRTYSRIRSAAKNGLAVVPIEREASAGTFIKIPPQRQIDIAQRKQIIVDEHSGRILVDKALAEEEKARMDVIMDKELKKLKH